MDLMRIKDAMLLNNLNLTEVGYSELEQIIRAWWNRPVVPITVPPTVFPRNAIPPIPDELRAVDEAIQFTDYVLINTGKPQVHTLHGTPEKPIRVICNMAINWRTSFFGENYILHELNYYGDYGTPRIGSPSKNVVVRGCNTRGTLARKAGFEIGRYPNKIPPETGRIENILYRDNTIANLGDIETEADQDATGIAIGQDVSNLWVLNNTISRTSGSGLQICAGRGLRDTTHHIFVGRNTFINCRQSGAFTKEAVDVIFAYNKAKNILPTPMSAAKGFGYQYAPDNVWFVANEVDGAEYGIYGGSDLGSTGNKIYVTGNVLNNIGLTSVFRPTDAWTSAAIMLMGGTQRYIWNNKGDNVSCSVCGPGKPIYNLRDNNFIKIRDLAVFIPIGFVTSDLLSIDNIKNMFAARYPGASL